MSRSTLEQWRMFQAVVEHGGFAQAAEAVHKSQSSINHAVHKLQEQIGLPLLEVVGRKAQLTDAGTLMLRRAGQLLDLMFSHIGLSRETPDKEAALYITNVLPWRRRPRRLSILLHGSVEQWQSDGLHLSEASRAALLRLP